ncbi:ATP/GTP-binding protein [Blastococcus colisei]|uniref:ATP/GTP-binding protein n=1 Tax=Blastococcus colisei TaxID=1564162 RepID=UPI0011522C28|nr:ATP/GTP-binding protein [Blastococcus colisei]
MLTLARIAGLAAALVTVSLAAPGTAAGAPPVECQRTDPRTGICVIWVPAPPGDGDGGRGGEDGSAAGPADTGGEGAAEDPNPCTYEIADPQPWALDPVWAGQTPESGTIWLMVCPPPAGFSRDWVARIFLPNGADPTPATQVDPRMLAEQAIASMVMHAPQIGMAPPPGSASGLVGLPVWMWTERGEHTTGPTRQSASAGGVTVTAVGEVSRIVWDMGDGNTVICGAGTPYPAGSDGESPDCGYTYATASANHVPGGGPWPITATSTWTITWSGGGQSGTEVLELSSDAELSVGELHVLNQDGT